MTPVPISDILAAWQRRLESCRELHAQVDGAELCALALADLQLVQHATADESLSLQEAAAECGYHVDSLSRLMRAGRLANVGTAHRPRFRRGDLPHRAGPKRGTSAPVVAIGRGSDASSAAALVRDAVASRSNTKAG